jgi:hypothetical protein
LPEGDPGLREFLEEDVWGLDAARPTLPHEDSTEMHTRLLAERPAVAAVKVLPLPDEDETDLNRSQEM